MTTMVIPVHITFKEWASQIRIDLPDVTIPTPSDVDSWRSWACQVVYDNSLNNDIPLPTKLGYPKSEDWKKWAAYFVGSIYN